MNAAEGKFQCRRCGTALPVPHRELGASVECPNCGAKFTLVPRPAEFASLIDDELTAEAARAELPEPEPPVDLAKEQLVRDAKTYGEHGERFERRERPPVPKHVFWSGILTFPFYRSTLTHYLAMTVAWVLLVLYYYLATLAFAFLSLVSIVFYFFATALAIILAAHSAACCLGVIVESADGVDEVHEWPDMNWKDWFTSLLQPGFSLAVAASVGYLFVFLPEIDSLVPAVVVAAVLFPFLILSAIEADSFAPISPVIFRSLTGVAWAWLVFYVEWGLLLGAVGWLGKELVARLGLGGMLAMAPVVAAALLIGSRLLGRLGWCIARWMEARMAAEEA